MNIDILEDIPFRCDAAEEADIIWYNFQSRDSFPLVPQASSVEEKDTDDDSDSNNVVRHIRS